MEKEINNQIIDWERKGNLIRFYLGENGKQCGDDWNDVPYEHNAGRVYDEFIKGHEDIVVPFEHIVLEPCDYLTNSRFCKQDMVDKVIPCIVVVDEDELALGEGEHICFVSAMTDPRFTKYYFGKVMNNKFRKYYK